MHDCENLKFAIEELKHFNSIIHDFDNAYNSCHKNLTDKHSTADSNKYSRKVNQLMIDFACEVSWRSVTNWTVLEGTAANLEHLEAIQKGELSLQIKRTQLELQIKIAQAQAQELIHAKA